MIEKIKDLVTAGEGVFEIEHIDRHIDRISRDHKRLGELKRALDVLKDHGVEDVLFVDPKAGVIKLRSSDMIKIAMSAEVELEEKDDSTYGNALIGDIKINSVLKPSDVYSVRKESGAFVFSPDMRARNLVEFIECIAKSDDSAVEHFFYNGDFETWLKSIGKIDLAKSFKSRKRKRLLGSALKRDLSKHTLRYVKTKVKREVKADIKKRILNTIDKI